MRKIDVKYLEEGMILARTLFTDNGILFLKKDTKLIEKYILKIKKSGYEYVYIEDEISKDIEIEEIVDDKFMNETKSYISAKMKELKLGAYEASDGVKKKVDEIIDIVLNDEQTMISIQKIKNSSDYLFMHSINVCVLSLVIGKKMRLPDTQLKSLAIGAMLHDLGKIRVKYNCNRYHEDYTAEERPLYLKHVDEGYELIKEFRGFSLQIANIARTHHEKYDGSGYPLGLKGNAINLLVRIVSVANEYDNLFNNPQVHMTMKNHEIIDYITAKTYTYFDPDVIKIFRSTVAPFPLGCPVKLSDGRMGIVMKLNSDFPTKPVIRIVERSSLKIVGNLDLSKELSVIIEDEMDIDKKKND